jgi:methionine synthase I (cobalamin-dependent)
VSSEPEETGVSAPATQRNRFLERLERGPAIVADGGMGALLTAAVPRLRTPEEANLRAPDAVVSLHVSFINAGAELIETGE